MSFINRSKSRSGGSWKAPTNDLYGRFGKTGMFGDTSKQVIMPGVTRKEGKRLNSIRKYVEDRTGQECTLPQHIIEDVYSMYVNDDFKRKATTGKNAVKQKIIDKVYNSLTKTVTKNSPLFSQMVTKELAVYMQKVERQIQEEMDRQKGESEAGDCDLGTGMDEPMDSMDNDEEIEGEGDPTGESESGDGNESNPSDEDNEDEQDSNQPEPDNSDLGDNEDETADNSESDEESNESDSSEEEGEDNSDGDGGEGSDSSGGDEDESQKDESKDDTGQGGGSGDDDSNSDDSEDDDDYEDYSKDEDENEDDNSSDENDSANQDSNTTEAGSGSNQQGAGDLSPQDQQKMDAIEEILDENESSLEEAMKEASDKMMELEEKFGKDALEDLANSEPDFMDKMDEIKSALDAVAINKESIKKVLSKILNKSENYFSKNFHTNEESLFECEECEDLYGLEFLNPMFRNAEIMNIVNETKVYTGKMDLYLDCSYSMNDYEDFEGTSIRMIDLVKGIAMVLYRMGMIERLYFFDDGLYEIENINEFTILAFNKSGGTNFNRVVDQISINNRNSVVVTDGFDSVYRYIKQAFWIGVGGTDFTGGGFDTYRATAQCVTYDEGKFKYCK